MKQAGKQDQYKLGQYLGKRYRNLIGTRYSSKQMYVRSTDEERCLLSAECTMFGLYPTSNDENWNDKLNFQPIPIHTMPLIDDYLLNSFAVCPRFDELFQQSIRRPNVTEIIEKYRPLIRFLEENSGEKLQTVKEVSWIYLNLLVENQNGFW